MIPSFYRPRTRRIAQGSAAAIPTRGSALTARLWALLLWALLLWALLWIPPLTGHAQPSQQTAQALPTFRQPPTVGPLDTVTLAHPQPLHDGEWTLQARLDYVRDPLTIHNSEDSQRTLSLVSHQLSAQLGAAFTPFKGWLFFGQLRAYPWMTGDGLPDTVPAPATDRGGLGDVQLGGRVALPLPDSFLKLGAQLLITVPLAELTNEQQAYRGETAVTAQPQILMAIHHGRVRLLFNGGMVFREALSLLDARRGHELSYGAGVDATIAPRQLSLHLEALGTMALGRHGPGSATDLRSFAGVTLFPQQTWSLRAAVGMGLSRGVGAPEAQGLVQVQYRSDSPKPPVPDADGDGISDSRDHCPELAEDADGFADQDGCPEPDNDRDGIADSVDRCPLEAEDNDGFADQDGCPELDNDHDGVPDEADRCPYAAENPADGQVNSNYGCPHE